MNTVLLFGDTKTCSGGLLSMELLPDFSGPAFGKSPVVVLSNWTMYLSRSSKSSSLSINQVYHILSPSQTWSRSWTSDFFLFLH